MRGKGKKNKMQSLFVDTSPLSRTVQITTGGEDTPGS